MGQTSRRRAIAMLFACAAALPSSAAENGSIEGTVRLGSHLVDRHARFALYPDPNRSAQPRPAGGLAEELANVVLYLESVPAGATPPAPRPGSSVMRQEGLDFIPHVLPIVQGESVEFLNSDPLFHNVFSLSKASTFDLGRYPSGKSRSVRFTEPGVVKVFCHLHSDMSGVVLVLANPFFTSPGRDGRYVLSGLPPGTYRLSAWHPRARASHRTVRVEPGGAALADFEIPLTEDEE